MNEAVSREVEKIKAEWEKEIRELEPLKISTNTLNNSLNKKRIDISNKYIKKIKEVTTRHS